MVERLWQSWLNSRFNTVAYNLDPWWAVWSLLQLLFGNQVLPFLKIAQIWIMSIFFFLRHFSELSSHETECTPRSIYYERGTTACLRAGHLLFSSQSKQVKGMCLTLSLPSAGQVSIMGPWTGGTAIKNSLRLKVYCYIVHWNLWSN